MTDRTSSSPAASTRAPRNAACTSCRTSKVRCNPGREPGTPCQRCAKLELECAVDPTFRRVTRRRATPEGIADTSHTTYSQLDQLAREVQAIKQAVDTTTQLSPQTTTAASLCTSRLQSNRASHASPSSITAIGTQSAYSGPASPHGRTVTDTPVPLGSVTPSQPRALNSLPFTGGQIDRCFQDYFEHFHKHFPVVSDQDPNKCYDTSPLLFWVVVLIAHRRLDKDTNHYQTVAPGNNSTATTTRPLTDFVKQETDTIIAKLPLTLPLMHALLLIAAWGLYPGIRFISDTAHWLVGLVNNSCLVLGLHTNKGRHAAFSHPSFDVKVSDHQAAVTWTACCVLSQRVSSYLGLPATSPSFNKATREILHSSLLPPIFQVQLECQSFISRISKTVSSCLEETLGVPSELVRMFEDEWDQNQASLLARHPDPLTTLHTLLVLQEVQIYYLLPIGGTQSSDRSSSSQHSLEADALRCYDTAQQIIAHVSHLDETTNFLLYVPHIYFRAIVTSVFIIFKVVRSALPLRHRGIRHDTAAKSCADALPICRRVSVVEGDLPWRLARCVEVWQSRSAAHLERIRTCNNDASITAAADTTAPEQPDSDLEPITVDTYRERMAASLSFDFMNRWKTRYGPVHMGPYGREQVPQQQQPAPYAPTTAMTGILASQAGTEVPPSAAVSDLDPLLGADWGFLDDFNWNFDATGGI
ncbi:hypothetical protein Micbo1qcDRAFT_215945 [Microdochium bolleyi]|uniref:Zn(2)-C6 fungal-type domain-containing protein n=1 Tax=Microdochium bolleyi TaxID=196109 RepID=A0A136IRQ9_9PEZI|nr:hypothetical protein Micbo1qcDRAFT_215945 [Microdochium bolleyi]